MGYSRVFMSFDKDQPPKTMMKFSLFILAVFVASTLAQDTHYCPDGWELHHPEGRDKCQCFYFAEYNTRVNHADATTICEYHGGWLAEALDVHDNHWIVDQLLQRLGNEKSSLEPELEGAHHEDQWWIGAKSYTKHDEHNPGAWYWERTNATVEWFDWAPGQPNDHHRQQCMTYIRYDYFGDQTYNWNDRDCNDVADYICEKPCVTF